MVLKIDREDCLQGNEGGGGGKLGVVVKYERRRRQEGWITDTDPYAPDANSMGANFIWCSATRHLIRPDIVFGSSSLHDKESACSSVQIIYQDRTVRSVFRVTLILEACSVRAGVSTLMIYRMPDLLLYLV